MPRVHKAKVNAAEEAKRKAAEEAGTTRAVDRLGGRGGSNPAPAGILMQETSLMCVKTKCTTWGHIVFLIHDCNTTLLTMLGQIWLKL